MAFKPKGVAALSNLINCHREIKRHMAERRMIFRNFRNNFEKKWLNHSRKKLIPPAFFGDAHKTHKKCHNSNQTKEISTAVLLLRLHHPLFELYKQPLDW